MSAPDDDTDDISAETKGKKETNVFFSVTFFTAVSNRI